MALRATEEGSDFPVPGLNLFWQEPEKAPSYHWEQWLQLFAVAVLARYSISVSELTRVADDQNPRAPALLGNLEEMPAVPKVTRFPQVNILLIQLPEFTQHCNECFQMRPI